MSITKKAAYLSGMLKKYGGVRGLALKVMETGSDAVEKAYRENWQNYMITDEEWKTQRDTVFEQMPLISVVVPTYETPGQFLDELVDSLKRQSYENWELCIADGSQSDDVEKQVLSMQSRDKRIKYERLFGNGGISVNTNAGFQMASGEYTGLLDHDDILAPNALFEVAKAVNEHPECEVFYSDEDKIDASGKEHSKPHFKLDYNKELLLHYNYICHFLVVKKTLLETVGGLNPEYDGSQDYDLVLRLSEQTEHIWHIEKILYHWRVHETSTAGSSLSKDYAYDAGKRALEAYAFRNDIRAEIKEVPGRAYYKWDYKMEPAPMSEIDWKGIQTGQELMVRIRACREEYIFVWNSERVKPLTEKQKEELVLLCMQRKIGVVGVRFSQKGKIISAGIEKKSDGTYGGCQEGLPAVYQGYFSRAVIPQNTEAVPLDCCVIRKSACEQAGGIRADLSRIMTAVDFAKRIKCSGYEVVLDGEITTGYVL